MGGLPSTPRGDARPQEHGDYLLGVLVGARAIDLHSQFWERLLNLPLSLHWTDEVINDACESIVQNGKSTGHLAKLLLHLGWSLQEVSDSSSHAQPEFAKTTNAVRFSSVFLKYAIEHLSNHELRSCLSLSLNNTEAIFTGLRKGNHTVAGFTVFAMLSFIGKSDVNPYTYVLHLEIGNLLLVMMSTQLLPATSGRSLSNDIFFNAAMLQERALVSLVVSKLLLSYSAQLPLPTYAPHYFNLSKPTTPGMLQRVGLAAATSPLATNSVLLLLLLVNHRTFLEFEDNLEMHLDSQAQDAATLSDCSHVRNLYCQALKMARDREFSFVDAAGVAAEYTLRISFTSLYDALGLWLTDECTILLLYTLVCGNSAFLDYVLVRTDLDTLIMPLLEMLHESPTKSTKQIYMLVIILLIFSQDSSFNSSLHKLVLSGVSWFKDQILSETTLGSLMVVVLIRTVKYNLSVLRDVYLHACCLATLSNMAPHMHKLSAYASQRLISLFEMFSRKYVKITDASKELHVGVEHSQSPELHIYADFLQLVLEIINAILTWALPHNPEVVYALLHRQELFKPFQEHPMFSDLVENIHAVLCHFNSQLDVQKHDENEWSVGTVLQAIVIITRSWRGEGIKIFPQLQFTYEEDQCPEEFFVPYIWQLVVSYSGISWNEDIITLFSPKAAVKCRTSTHSELPSTPRMEV